MVTARVKISQNVDILAKVHVYLVEHCQTLCVKVHLQVKIDRFWLVKALSCIVQGVQNDSQNQSKPVKTSQKCLCVHISSTVKTASWLILTAIAARH